MQFYNNLKQKLQEGKKGFSLSPDKGLSITQNKPPLVESRSIWNKNVYFVPKWEKRDIKHVESNNHTPFPIRNYINYVQQHSEGFSNSLNLDFFKHIIRHFAVNQWWIDQTKIFKSTIPINILQTPEIIQQNNQIYQLLIQKSNDDLNFYNTILSNTKPPQIPIPEKQLQEYKSSITYQVLDFNATQKFQNQSLFQLQDIFIKRIIQLLSERGLSGLGYYDYLTFQKIVEDQKQGICDAQTFLKVLEIKRLFNQINLNSLQNQSITNQINSQNQNIQSQNTLKFRRWNQEKVLLSNEIQDLANYVGLDINLKRARKNYELNKTEQQFNELIIIGDQISSNAQKIILDTQSKFSKGEQEVFQSSEQFQQFKVSSQNQQTNGLVDQFKSQLGFLQDKTDIDFNMESSENQFNLQNERIDNQKQKSQERQITDKISKQTQIDKFDSSFHSPQKHLQDKLLQNPNQFSQPNPNQLSLSNPNQLSLPNSNQLSLPNSNQFSQSNPNQLSKLQSTQKVNQNISPQKKIIQIPKSNSNSNSKPKNSQKSQEQYQKYHKNSNQRFKDRRLEEQNRKLSRNLQSQLSQQSLRSYEDYLNPIELENISSNNLPINLSHNYHTQNEIKQNLSSHQNRQSQIITSYNSISLHQDRKKVNDENDVQLMIEFIKKNKKYQTELQDKLFNKDSKNLQGEDLEEFQSNRNLIQQIDINQINESQNSSDDIDHIQSLAQKEVKSLHPQYQDSEIHNSMPESISNNTTARTLRNTSNQNYVHPIKNKFENLEDQNNDKHEQLQTINEISRKISPILVRQTSIKNYKKSSEQKQLQKPIKDFQEEKQFNQVNLVNSPDIIIQSEVKQEEISNNMYSQKSIDLPSVKIRNTLGITEKSKSQLKSSTNFTDQNKQIIKDQQKIEITSKFLDTQQENKRNKNKFYNREVFDDPMEDESDQEQENDEAEKINNPINKEYKKKKKAKLQQLSTSKQERIEDHKRYLQFLKQELKEMLDKKVNLKEIKEHINIILSEIGGISLDQDLDYYIQLYKSRAQELSQVNVESHEIRFQNQQPICELKLKREIKGLKFAKDCDRITKLKPVDYEDIIESQNQIQIEEEQKDFQEYQTYHYSPQFRYEQKPSPLQTDLIQVSLDVTRSQTPNKRRLYRTNPRFESDFTINRFKKKSSNKNTKQQKYQKQTQPIMMKKDPLNDNFPYLHKYKPELLKTILEARINLEQLI